VRPPVAADPGKKGSQRCKLKIHSQPGVKREKEYSLGFQEAFGRRLSS